jgi:hypothetical protein
MVYCPVPHTPTSGLPALPAAAASEELLAGSPEEVFLGNGDARYYNLTSAMTIPLPGSNGNTGRRRHSIGTFLNKDRGGYGSLSKTPVTTPTAAEGETGPAISSDVMQLMSSGSNGSKVIKTQETVTGGCSPPEWRHHAAASPKLTADLPRPAHSRRRCNRCCNAKGKCDSVKLVADVWFFYFVTCFFWARC